MLLLGLLAALASAGANSGAALLGAMATRRATRAATIVLHPMYLAGAGHGPLRLGAHGRRPAVHAHRRRPGHRRGAGRDHGGGLALGVRHPAAPRRPGGGGRERRRARAARGLGEHPGRHRQVVDGGHDRPPRRLRRAPRGLGADRAADHGGPSSSSFLAGLAYSAHRGGRPDDRRRGLDGHADPRDPHRPRRVDDGGLRRPGPRPLHRRPGPGCRRTGRGGARGDRDPRTGRARPDPAGRRGAPRLVAGVRAGARAGSRRRRRARPLARRRPRSRATTAWPAPAAQALSGSRTHPGPAPRPGTTGGTRP